MQTKTYNVYKFDELSDKAKENARDNFREKNDYPFLADYMREQALQLLEKNNIKASDVQVYFSLSHSQGDGAMVAMTAEWNDYAVKVKQAGHYSHERSTDIEMYKDDGEGNCEYVDHESFEESIYIPMCQKLRDYGYDYIDSEQQAEFIDEELRVNDYDFTSDGTID